MSNNPDVKALLKRPYMRTVVPQEDGSYHAEIVEFPGCMATGETAAQALETLEGVAESWLAAVIDAGQQVPPPLENSDYSGKLVLRMPRGLHRKSALLAEREGASLNQFIVACLAERVGSAMPQATPEVDQKSARAAFAKLLETDFRPSEALRAFLSAAVPTTVYFVDASTGSARIAPKPRPWPSSHHSVKYLTSNEILYPTRESAN